MNLENSVRMSIGSDAINEAVSEVTARFSEFERDRKIRREEIENSTQQLLKWKHVRRLYVLDYFKYRSPARVEETYKLYADDISKYSKENLELEKKSNELIAKAVSYHDKSTLFEIKFLLENVDSLCYGLYTRFSANELKMNSIRNRKSREKIALIQMYLDDLKEAVLKVPVSS